MQREGPAERLSGRPYVAGRQTLSDVRRRPGAPVGTVERQSDDLGLMLGAEGAQEVHVAECSMAEPEVLSDDHPRRVQRAEDDQLGERLCRLVGQLGREGQDEHRVRTGRGQERGPILDRRQRQRSLVGPDDRHGVRVEGDGHDRQTTEPLGQPSRLGQHMAVAPVYPVEVADRDDARPEVAVDLCEVMPDLNSAGAARADGHERQP
jgi:hypothetical protein